MGVFDPCRKKIFIACKNRINACGNRRAKKRPVVLIADQRFAIYFLDWNGDDFERQKGYRKEGFEERNFALKFAIENSSGFVDILLADKPLIGCGYGF